LGKHRKRLNSLQKVKNSGALKESLIARARHRAGLAGAKNTACPHYRYSIYQFPLIDKYRIDRR
jgi:hypothetical protein